MDTVTLVGNQIDDGQKLLDRLDRDGVNVLAACWAKPADEDRWSLYIATPVVDEKGAIEAYREVYRVLRAMRSFWITDSDIKLIGEKHPVTKDLLDLLRRHPGVGGAQSTRLLLGGTPTEEVYTYAPPRPRDTRSDLGLRRLKSGVQQRLHPNDLTAPYTPEERQAVAQLEASGMSPDQAKYWIWKRREKDREARSIPSGAIVRANYAAWWGEKPEDDPNPLLLIEAGDGAQGHTFLDNTEPV
jgi:hypothetical protein